MPTITEETISLSSPSLFHCPPADFAPRYVHKKVISGFQALRQARSPVVRLETVTIETLQISGPSRYPLCYRRPELRRRGKKRICGQVVTDQGRFDSVVLKF
ncbi:hypothetical protein PoB_006091500 [Plakobranchus ocellatus]|uniref:Uncharacterized protein n=1 Tax=Plakobranchus ocellatus TaxID=259542 RepID=A0AAV4CR70_9GAST|nr:hypothetical protein PoB_006091500 [Plakobranchus ocellatus]